MPAPRPASRAVGSAALLLLLSGCFLFGHKPQPLGADASRLLADVTWLADDAREGRGTGTPGNDSAGAWIARRYEVLDVAPAAMVNGTRAYLQPFQAKSIVVAHAGGPADGLATQNVVAMIPGTDPALRGQYVVLGAHFDHLGRSTFGAADPQAGDAIRNGADDNASGTAALLELARILRQRPLRRSVLFVHFSGEELGLLGSQWFVEHSPVPLDSVQAMLNFDMVGRLVNDKLLVYGVATARELPAIVDSANARMVPPLAITAIGDGFGPSDHSSFYAKNVPVLHFFTNVHEDYHKATDDAARINAPGEARVVQLAWRIVREIGDRPGRLSFVRAPQPAQAGGSMRQGSNVYFGSVPDMAAGEVKGMRLSGVTPGSPADIAGFREGDVIVEFDGKEVSDLYSYTDALYARKPGDTVKVVYLRGGERREATVTLGRRGESRSE